MGPAPMTRMEEMSVLLGTDAAALSPLARGGEGGGGGGGGRNPELGRKRLTPIARKLRADQTDAEERLWLHLRGRRLIDEKFVRPLQIDDYVAVSACRTARLAIELDGGQHDAIRDAARTAIIEKYGYRVLRFWDGDMLTNTDGVLEA